MPVLELVNRLYGIIVVLGLWDALCDWLDWMMHLLQVRLWRGLINSPRRVGLVQAFFAKGRPGGQLFNFERANNSPRREGSRLSEIPHCFPVLVLSPRLGGGGLAWARPFSLSEVLSETVLCLDVCSFLDDWFWFGYECYDDGHVYNGVWCIRSMIHEL